MPNRTLQQFRGDPRAAIPLHPLEVALLAVVAVHLCFLPWALGGMRVWAQFISLFFALAALLLALLPRHYAEPYTRDRPYRLTTAKRLLRFPLFWLGLLFFGYVLIQALNPAWEFVQKPRAWTMQPVPHVDWLPSGMRTPFEMMNPWRQLLIWIAPWLVGCALWTGLTRRRSIVLLLTLLVANATVLSLLGTAQRFTAGRKILWSFESTTPYHFATLLYKNHAGAFFALMAAVAVVLAAYHLVAAERRLARSNPGPIFLLLALISVAGVVLSNSRAAVLIFAVFAVVAIVTYFIRIAFFRRDERHPLVVSALALLFVGFVALGAHVLRLDKTINRIEALFGDDYSVLSRRLVNDAGWDMAQEHLATGWGAGGFRFLFPAYQQHYPEIFMTERGTGARMLFWEHAHNDYLQLVIETGFIGAGVIGLGLLALFGQLGRRGAFRRLPLFVFAAALLVTLAHAWVDFPFQNPAILTTWCALAALALRWSTLERAEAPPALRAVPSLKSQVEGRKPTG